jgi:hypothetical protein
MMQKCGCCNMILGMYAVRDKRYIIVEDRYGIIHINNR